MSSKLPQEPKNPVKSEIETLREKVAKQILAGEASVQRYNVTHKDEEEYYVTSQKFISQNENKKTEVQVRIAEFETAIREQRDELNKHYATPPEERFEKSWEQKVKKHLELLKIKKLELEKWCEALALAKEEIQSHDTFKRFLQIFPSLTAEERAAISAKNYPVPNDIKSTKGPKQINDNIDTIGFVNAILDKAEYRRLEIFLSEGDRVYLKNYDLPNDQARIEIASEVTRPVIQRYVDELMKAKKVADTKLTSENTNEQSKSPKPVVLSPSAQALSKASGSLLNADQTSQEVHGPNASDKARGPGMRRK